MKGVKKVWFWKFVLWPQLAIFCIETIQKCTLSSTLQDFFFLDDQPYTYILTVPNNKVLIISPILMGYQKLAIDTSSPTGWSRPIPSQPRCWSTSGARVWTTWRMFGPLDRKEWLEELLRPNGKWWQVDVYKRHRLATYLCKTWLTRSYLVYPKNMFANDDLCRESLQNQLSSRWWNEL